MEKKFNVTGTCIPEKHYMVNISEKLKNIKWATAHPTRVTVTWGKMVKE